MKKKILLWFVLFLTITGTGLAQTTTVTGVVISSEDDQPVIGATVQVKGTTLGSVTGTDGRFTIPHVPQTARLLTVSYVGMETVEVAIGPNLIIRLNSDAEMLDEVMVVAYGTAKKSSYTGSASVVRADAIKDLPTTSFEKSPALMRIHHQKYLQPVLKMP